MRIPLLLMYYNKNRHDTQVWEWTSKWCSISHCRRGQQTLTTHQLQLTYFWVRRKKKVQVQKRDQVGNTVEPRVIASRRSSLTPSISRYWPLKMGERINIHQYRDSNISRSKDKLAKQVISMLMTKQWWKKRVINQRSFLQTAHTILALHQDNRDTISDNWSLLLLLQTKSKVSTKINQSFF